MKIYRVMTWDSELYVAAGSPQEAEETARRDLHMSATALSTAELVELAQDHYAAVLDGDMCYIDELIANDEVEHGLSRSRKQELDLLSDYELAPEFEVEGWLGQALLDASRVGGVMLEVGEGWLAVTGFSAGSCLATHRLCDHGLPVGEYRCGPVGLDGAPSSIRLREGRLWLSEERSEMPLVAMGAERGKVQYVNSALTEEGVDLRSDKLMRTRRHGRDGIVVGADAYDMALIRPLAEVVGWAGWEMISNGQSWRAIAHHEGTDGVGWRLAMVEHGLSEIGRE